METIEKITGETGRKYKCQDIVKALEANIVGSQLAAGVELPCTAELASRYRVSEKTVHRALQHLADRKLIRRVRGSGSFVRGNMGLPPHSRIGFFYFESLNVEIPSFNNILCQNSRLLLKQILEDAGLAVEFHSEQMPNVENCPLLGMELSRFDYIIAEAGYRLVAEQVLRNFPGEVILFGDDEFVFGPWHQVFFDYRPGMRKALEHLMKMGFRKALVVGAVRPGVRQAVPEGVQVRHRDLFTLRSPDGRSAGCVVRTRAEAGTRRAADQLRQFPEQRA